jgi:tetratricopeptide (TPR) repeat protein
MALRELTDTHLVLEETPGRYTRHDLLRAYAMELLDTTESAEARHAALRRMIDYYLYSTVAADAALSPHRDMSPLASPKPPVDHAEFSSYGEAMHWISLEYPSLRGLVEQAVAADLPDHAWRLGWALRHYQDRRGHWDELAATQRTALRAASAMGDRTALAYAHRGIARAENQYGRYESTAHHLERARALFEEEGDMMGLAYTLRQSHWLFQLTGDIEQAHTQALRALELFTAEGWQLGEAAALGLIGWSHVLRSRRTAAAGRFLVAAGNSVALRHIAPTLHDRLGGAASLVPTETLRDEWSGRPPKRIRSCARPRSTSARSPRHRRQRPARPRPARRSSEDTVTATAESLPAPPRPARVSRQLPLPRPQTCANIRLSFP